MSLCVCLTPLSAAAQDAGEDGFDPYATYRDGQIPSDFEYQKDPPIAQQTIEAITVQPELSAPDSYADTEAATQPESLTLSTSPLPELLEPELLESEFELSVPELTVPTAPKPAPPTSDLAAFYLSAQEYLELRGQDTAQTHVLTYDILQSDSLELTDNAKAAQPITLIIGPDYAAKRDLEALTIYDFKLNRIVTVQPEHFSNTSLFAAVYRNIQTISTVTEKGTKDTINVSPDRQVEAFWIEASLGTAIRPRSEDISHDQDEQGQITASFKGQPVMTLEASDMVYATPQHSDSMLIFAHHAMSIHPSLLEHFYQAKSPPQRVSIKTVSPTFPEGVFKHWVLTSHDIGYDAFPLASSATNITAGDGASPLVKTISSAAADKSAGLSPTPSDLGAQATALLEAGDIMQAWLIAQTGLAHGVTCEHAAAACEVIASIESQPERDEALDTLIQAFKDSERPSTRAAAVSALQPWASQPDTAGIILRVLGVARAKLTAAEASSAGLSEINAQALLIESLTKDPFDPKSYVGLAQYYAANGKAEASWDMYDALRHIGPKAEPGISTINRAETRLKRQAPGYFTAP